MANELLVEYIEDGRKLIELLDQDGRFKVTNALWYYVSESSQWRLLIGSPYVGKRGNRKSYQFIQSIIKNTPNFKLSLDLIAPMKSKDPLFDLLRIMIKCEGYCGIRMTNTTINGFLIEDTYIYRNI